MTAERITAKPGATFLDRLRSHGYLTEEPKVAPVLPDWVQLPPTDPRAVQYANGALRKETARVATAVEGTRNDALNKAAFNLGRFVEEGHLAPDVVLHNLFAAARAAGLPVDEINRTVKRAIGDGARKLDPPRLDPRDDPTAAPAVTTLETTPTPQPAATPEPMELPEPEPTEAFTLGGTFVLDIPDHTPAVWGEGDNVLWARGESLIIAAGNGAGKTTLAGQLVAARLGVTDTVLGFPVEPTERRVLYLAMDRPSQIRRSLRRHFRETDRQALDARLIVWKGPPPADLAAVPEMLLRLVQSAGADTLVVDSLKDAAIGLSDDAVGAGWNRARQMVIAAGCEVLELHHNVKRNATGGTPDTISDVYGSTWITAGVGSAILLVGAPGDPVVQFRHVKQPADEVGPFQVLHDHDAGVSTIYEQVDPLAVLRAKRTITALEMAEAMFQTAKATLAEKEKARRKLDRMVDQGLATKVEGDRATGTPTLYTWVDPQGVMTL